MGHLAETILERDKPACRQAGNEDAGVVTGLRQGRVTQSQSKIVQPRSPKAGPPQAERGSPSFARLTALLLLDVSQRTRLRRRALQPDKIWASKCPIIYTLLSENR